MDESEARIILAKVFAKEMSFWSDNLARAEHQQRAMPTWTSGNDESISTVIEQYRDGRDKTRAAAAIFGVTV